MNQRWKVWAVVAIALAIGVSMGLGLPWFVCAPLLSLPLGWLVADVESEFI